VLANFQDCNLKIPPRTTIKKPESAGTVLLASGLPSVARDTGQRLGKNLSRENDDFVPRQFRLGFLEIPFSFIELVELKSKASPPYLEFLWVSFFLLFYFHPILSNKSSMKPGTMQLIPPRSKIHRLLFLSTW